LNEKKPPVKPGAGSTCCKYFLMMKNPLNSIFLELRGFFMKEQDALKMPLLPKPVKVSFLNLKIVIQLPVSGFQTGEG